MTDIELLPCPFCGGSAQVRMPAESDGFAIHVACRCGAQLYGRTRHFSDDAEASAAWNTRAPEPAQPAEAEGVEALAPKIAGWVCEARNEWCDTVESTWLEDSESNPDADTFVGEYIARRLRNSPESHVNINKKEEHR